MSAKNNGEGRANLKIIMSRNARNSKEIFTTFCEGRYSGFFFSFLVSTFSSQPDYDIIQNHPFQVCLVRKHIIYNIYKCKKKSHMSVKAWGWLKTLADMSAKIEVFLGGSFHYWLVWTCSLPKKRLSTETSENPGEDSPSVPSGSSRSGGSGESAARGSGRPPTWPILPSLDRFESKH